MVSYVNTSSAGALGAYPRARYRLTVERAGLSSVSFALGVLSWPNVVAQVQEAIGRSGFGIPLGSPRPADSDRVAVLDVRAPTSPGTGDSVGDLVTAANAGSDYARVVRVERLPPVPGFSDPARSADNDAREAEATRAASDAERSGLLDGLRTFGDRASLSVAIALGVAIVLAVAIVGRNVDKVGDAINWD